MRKIFQVLGKAAEVKTEVGIEVECEGQYINPVVAQYWKAEDDGSLRGRFPDGRCEFVLINPIFRREVGEALDKLVESQKYAKFNFSYRTSVHVHINVQGITQLQLLNLVYTYLLIEEPLFTFCGKERKGNRFCLRLQDAEGILDIVNSFIQKGVGVFKDKFGENAIRYSALNLAAVSKYGSVEFRGMRGTIEKAVIKKWVDALLALKDYAIMQKDPIEIHNQFVEQGPEKFLETVLQYETKTFIYPKLKEDMSRSFSLSIDIPHMYKTFGKWMLTDEVPDESSFKPGAKKMIMNNLNPADIPRDEWERFAPMAVLQQAVQPGLGFLRNPGDMAIFVDIQQER